MIDGKGMYLWLMGRLETPDQIARLAKEAGMGHLLVKIADGAAPMPGEIEELVGYLHSEGIQVLAWQYIYSGSNAEADIAVQLCQQYGMDGFIVNAEKEFDKSGMDGAARGYMARLRSGLGDDFVIGLSSYRYPAAHLNFPFKAFLEKCDLVMPQVYWMDENELAAPKLNLEKTLFAHKTLFARLKLTRPIVFTGAAFSEHGWCATPEQVNDFMRYVDKLVMSESLVLAAVNFWEWWEARTENPTLWQVIEKYPWRNKPMSDFNIWSQAVTDALRVDGHKIPDPPVTTIPKPETYQVSIHGTINVRNQPGGADIGDVSGIVTIQPPTQRMTFNGNWYTWGLIVDPPNKAGWIALENTTRL